MFTSLLADFRTIHERDPACKSWIEVLFFYPGLQALTLYRIAHGLHLRGLPLLPRFITHLGRFLTGVEIHPGACIGKGVFIDHGMGVVIGETAVVGDHALIYQGVTLGGTGDQQGKRHPTLGRGVAVGAGAKVLGNINIGHGVRIGAGSIVLRDIPADCTVVGVPGRIVRHQGRDVDPINSETFPDPGAEVIQALFKRIKLLEQEISSLKMQLRTSSSDRSLSAGESSFVTTLSSSTSFPAGDKVIQDFLDGAGI